MTKFFDDWATEMYSGIGYAALLKDFEISPGDISEHEILFASYTYEDYSGSATVIFERGGKVYEVNGGHCSCYGLEGQWEAEETSWAALNARLGENGTDTYRLSDMSQESREALSALLAGHNN